jgi:hypothetical protein
MIMSRVIAVLACGFALSACSSMSWMPSMPSMDFMGSSGGGQQISLNVESDPPGADARTSTGAACKTPCSLPVQASGDFTVNFTLAGYLPQSVPVHIIPPEDARFGGDSTTRVDPNPVFAVLEKAPPPPPAKKRAPKKRTTAAPTAAAPAAAPAPAAAAPAATQPASATSAPWPMPR